MIEGEIPATKFVTFSFSCETKECESRGVQVSISAPESCEAIVCGQCGNEWPPSL